MGASVSCVNNGEASQGAMFMETMGNLQIANAGSGVAIQLNDGNGNGVPLVNITSSGGAVSATASVSGGFSVAANEVYGDLLQVSVNVADGLVDLFSSTVEAI